MKRFARVGAIVLLSALSMGAAQGEAPMTHSLTIYSSTEAGGVPPEVFRGGGQQGYAVPGYAVIRHERPIQLKSGRNELRFSDVAALIDPTTVSFRSLTDPAGTRVVEQNFQFDLVGTAKLLEKYVDREIVVELARGDSVEEIAGTLLSISDGLVLRLADGSVRTIPQHAGVRLPELPGGLITRPTLVWDIAAKQGGEHRARVAYQTAGITWWADYNLLFTEGKDANSCRLDVGASS